MLLEDYDSCISLQAQLCEVERFTERQPGGSSVSAESQEEWSEGRRAFLETALKEAEDKLAAAKWNQDFEMCLLLKAERLSLEAEFGKLTKGAQVHGLFRIV